MTEPQQGDLAICLGCSSQIIYGNLLDARYREPDYEGPGEVMWRHWGGYAACMTGTVPRATPRPEIVVLCGSTKFKLEFEAAARQLGLEGKICLTVAMFGHSGDLSPEEVEIGHPIKDSLDELHKRKIDLADRVLVLNKGGYIGDSTRSEIEYAQDHGKPIDYLEDQ